MSGVLVFRGRLCGGEAGGLGASASRGGGSSVQEDEAAHVVGEIGEADLQFRRRHPCPSFG